MKKIAWLVLVVPLAAACGGGSNDSSDGGAGSPAEGGEGGADGGADGGTKGSSDGGTKGSSDGGTKGSSDGGTKGSSDGGTKGSSDGGTGGTTEEMPDDTKPSATTIKFAANGVSCGLTDGFADQQHNLPELIHLNTDKCNGETFRPTFTLNFETGKTIEPGTYSVAAEAGPSKVKVISEQYNYTSWDGTAGSVVVTENSDDSGKLDIQLDSITMTNRTADDPKNPATDTVTGYIIGI